MIQDLVDTVLEDGPRRLMLPDGTAIKPGRPGSFDPTIIFVRDDGWSLGASPKTEELARKQWPDEWVAVLRRKHPIAPDWNEWETEFLITDEERTGCPECARANGPRYKGPCEH